MLLGKAWTLDRSEDMGIRSHNRKVQTVVYVLNPKWRNPVKPKSDVAKFAEAYIDWGDGSILPSQVHFFNEAYATKRNGLWKYNRVAENAPRQNAKTKKQTPAILYFMYVKHLDVFVSAHEISAVHKIFDDVYSTIVKNPELNAELGRYASSYGKEYIELTTGGSVTFRSRKNSQAGMGGTYSVVIFDEAQELKAEYDSMVTKTLKTKKNRLIIYLGTPFLPTSTGDVFKSILDGAEDDPSMFAVRYGTDDENADVHDKKLWALTNPLYPDVIPDASFESDIATANQNGAEGLRDFRIQNLGLWWKDKVPPAIPMDLWNAASKDVPNDPMTNVCAIVFDPACGRIALSLASCSAEMVDGTVSHSKGEYIVGEIIGERSQNTSWKWISETVGSMPRDTTIILDAGGLNKPIEKMLPMSMEIVKLTGPEFLSSQQGFYDLLENGRFKHTNQPDLMSEVRNSQKVQSGDQWKFASIDKSKSISGLKALAEAAWYRAVNEPVDTAPQVITF